MKSEENQMDYREEGLSVIRCGLLLLLGMAVIGVAGEYIASVILWAHDLLGLGVL